MSFLALDIGNSFVKAAAWSGGWSPVQRFPSDAASVDEWADRLAEFEGASRVGIASVAPTVIRAVAQAAQRLTSAPPVVVSAQRPLPFRMAYHTPATLGADRLAAAAAAWSQSDGRAVVVLDAGTAITTEAVSAEPAYLGGAILPGPDVMRQALARDTGQLPDVPWARPPAPIGRTTAEAIQAGLAVVVLDGVEGLLRRTVEAVGGDALVIATGGWAPWLADHIGRIDRVDPLLVLDGIRQLCD